MKFSIGGSLLACFALASAAQVQSQPPVPPPLPNAQGQTSAGIETPWQVQQVLKDLNADNQQLKPVLLQLNPQQWYDQKGASSTYIIQWHSAQEQVAYLLAVTARLGQKTEDLSLALEIYFRLEQLDVVTRSVLEGAQKYADRGVAGRLSELIAHNFNSRERFRGYLRDLAAEKEQDFKVADEEAQRCRASLSQQAPGKRTKR